MIDIKVLGLKELQEGLRTLAPDIGRNDLRAGVAAGAAEIRKEMKLNAQRIKVTGTLARSIYQKQIRERSGNDRQTFFIGPRMGKKYQRVGKKGVSKDAYYAPWVEFGHFARAPKTFVGPPKWVEPKAFMRPAYDTKKDTAVTAMAARLKQRLEQRRIGKK